MFFKVILLVLLFSVSAFADPCADILDKASFVEKVHSKTEQAALSLGLDEVQFKERLEAFGYTEEKFFQRVEEFKAGNKPFWSKLFNPKAIVEEIRGRKIANSTFIRDFFSFAIPNLSFQGFAHISVHGMQRFDLLSAQLFALVLTDVVLTASSAKHAAYLVANPKLLQDAKKLVQDLNASDKKRFFSFSTQLKKLLMATKRIAKNTFASAFNVGKVAFFASLVPFVALESSHGFGDTFLLNLVINSGFHTAFAALWSNARYQAIFGEALPAIDRSQLSPLKSKTATAALVSANVLLATFSYAYGLDFVHRIIGTLGL